jgi:RNA polymerase sigma-70 factor (ECF subfamily)
MTNVHDGSEPSTSVSMLQRARDGDAEGWRRLAQVYGPIVYGWARRCGCQSADAADVMQETFASVAGAIERFDHDRDGATFRGWLWTITRNKLRDRARAGDDQYAAGGTAAQIAMQQVPVPLQGLEAAEPPSESRSDAVSARRRTLELLRENFDPRSWRMFWETAVEGREPAAVAEEMAVSRWAVYKAKARVLQRLQQELAGL